ncbi:hypothetical protein ACJ41O_006091 [Fusarium nematophilum]
MNENSDIGFIGLGAMGYGMAMNVRKRMSPSATLYVHDVFRASCERFKSEFDSIGGVEIMDSARQVAEKASTIISIVPTGANVEDVYLNAQTGVIAASSSLVDPAFGKQYLYLECSTIDVATAKMVGKSLQQANMGTYIDSPVSGGVPAARDGSLSLLLGTTPNQTSGDSRLSERIRAIAQFLGPPEKTFYCGDLGSGLAAKICNNYLSCTILLANSEAMAMGLRMGLDRHLLHGIIQKSSGQNFMADHMLVKDVGLGVEAARSVGIAPTIGEAAMTVYEKMAEDEEYIVSKSLLNADECSLLHDLVSA